MRNGNECPQSRGFNYARSSITKYVYPNRLAGGVHDPHFSGCSLQSSAAAKQTLFTLLLNQNFAKQSLSRFYTPGQNVLQTGSRQTSRGRASRETEVHSTQRFSMGCAPVLPRVDARGKAADDCLFDGRLKTGLCGRRGSSSPQTDSRPVLPQSREHTASANLYTIGLSCVRILEARDESFWDMATVTPRSA